MVATMLTGPHIFILLCGWWWDGGKWGGIEN